MLSYTKEFSPPPMVTTPIPSGADFGIRFLARGIDIFFGIFLSLISGFVGGIVLAVLSSMGRIGENWVELSGQRSYWTYVFGILGGVLYHWFAEGIGGTTVGKLLCGLNVVQLDGRRCSFIGVFKRGLAYLVDALFFGLIALESMKKSVLRQRHGDVWGKTVVVKKSVFLPNPKPHAWRPGSSRPNNRTISRAAAPPRRWRVGSDLPTGRHARP